MSENNSGPNGVHDSKESSSPSSGTVPDSDTPSTQSTQPSLAGRIQSSATGLFQNTVLNTRSPAFGDNLSSNLSQSLASSAKADFPQPGAPRTGESSRQGIINGSSSSRQSAAASASRGHSGLQSESLRTIRTDVSSEDQELWNHFEQPFHVEIPIRSAKGKSKAVSSNPIPTPIFIESAPQADGSAVLSLLDSPAFDPLAPSSSLPPSPMLVPTPIPASMQPLSPLSLVPDIQSFLSTVPEQHLTSVPTVSEWLELDASYTDFVWGGALKEYTLEARKEVEERKMIGNGEDLYKGPAVRRLGMVLAHLRERSPAD
ncbi:hypothetical protein LOZ58_003022 [Ophidiomyces ophidiicola]|nr:hypothetical protein LOZ65_003395 [Ophidiomyces ophidiicola]KAI1961944.1 hypothetical protein LOZ58_003022 [Ophidiomyces ophidiicola]